MSSRTFAIAMKPRRLITMLAFIWFLAVEAAVQRVHGLTLQNIANVSYADEKFDLSALASIFSPRMDFDQWKPLTGRGDPLRNDPTYDYEPPVLDRVHYWADDTRLEREHYPERKSEVLVLGVSSRKPSVAPRFPPPPRRNHWPHHTKYEDYSYTLSEHYPMTILVPPPPPPPGHKPSLFILEETIPPLNKVTDLPKTTSAPERMTSSYALQESNLIFQASTTNHDWVFDYNHTMPVPNNPVSSDYAGWGPTTPLDEPEIANDTHNFISSDYFDYSKHPYSFYKPMLSEAPPPPIVTHNPLLLPTFIPTSLPPISSAGSTFKTSTALPLTLPTWPTVVTETETPTEAQDYYEDTTTTEKYISTVYPSTPAHITKINKKTKPDKTIFDMLNPMMTLPLVPDRQEDHLYAHASENLHVFKEAEDEKSKLETMQPPPTVVKSTESPSFVHKQPFNMPSKAHSSFLNNKPSLHTHDPYLHMRFTTPVIPTVASSLDTFENKKSTTEAPVVPMYLIIQGHSKVKTYGSKPKPVDQSETINNEIPKANETNEVKHLHPIKDKYSQPERSENIRKSRAQNLKALVEEGRGSIEIQEANIGIKYDVSDGSDVPLEIYRKGIVDNDENDYSKQKKIIKEKRTKRQIDFEDIVDLLPDEKTLDGYLYNFLENKKNSTGLTGVIAKVVTSNAGTVIDDLDEDDEEDDDSVEDDDDNDEDR